MCKKENLIRKMIIRKEDIKDKNVYRSSVGVMYFIVSLIIVGILIGSFLYTRGDGNMFAISIAFITATIAYYFVLIYPIINTKYILETDRLVINCGTYKNEIAFREISGVYKKTSFGRHPALSEKMVFIKYKNRGVVNFVGISPRNRDEFIQEIQKRIQN